jgi:hypothetical protein
MKHKHFGIEIREGKHGLKLTKANFIAGSRCCSFPGQYGAEYDGEGLAKYIRDCLKHFELSRKYFASLNPKDFDEAVRRFTRNNPEFEPVADLSEYKGKPGYYMMVLDDYRQVYLGTTRDIYTRIRKHWKEVKPLDRLISGSVDSSIISIDSFRCLDTTRIFVCATPEVYDHENKYIEQLPSEFLCNRTVGGKLKGGYGEAISLRRTRNLM